MENTSRQKAKFYNPFDHKWVLYLLAIIIFLGIQHIPLNGFNPQAHATIAVFGLAAFLWITSALPIAITGLVVLLMLPLSGSVSSTQAYSYFGNHAVFFVLGAFILASPVMRSGLSTRMAINILSYFGKSPTRLLWSILLLSALLSFVISEHAVAAMLMPIIAEIVAAAKIKPGNRFGFAAFLSMGWGACIGGTATLLGGARAPLALGMLVNNTTYNISFVQWFLFTIPIVVVLLLFTALFIAILVRKTNVDIQSARKQLSLYHKTLGPLSSREIYTLLILGFTIFLWITSGTSIGLDVIAFIGVILAFLFKIAKWSEVEHDVQWSIFIMYGSAIALSAALRDTGAAHSLMLLILKWGADSPLIIITLLVLLALVLTEAMSNAASVAVLMPIGLELAREFSIDPRIIAVGLATSAQ